jgi:predicted dithiol-disulfide oxidoreductase (DUF899 family)
VLVRCTIEDKDKNMSTQTVTEMKRPNVVSPKEWEAARQKLLVKEKELTRARDALAAERRRMPWLAVEKAYRFDGPNGQASLLDLFDGRRQPIVIAPSSNLTCTAGPSMPASAAPWLPTMLATLPI